MATESKVPYMHAYGYVTKVLDKIQTASTPDRFTQDFLATKLGLKGGSPKPVIPFLKRVGFLGSDGIPTSLYKEFRNSTQRGRAAADAIRTGYAPLYEINEYAHDADDKDLAGIIVQGTGLDASSKTIKSIIGSFRALQAFADFDASPEASAERTSDEPDLEPAIGGGQLSSSGGMRLAYTINLNLPATSDIAVFNAIFRSLREHLVQD